MQEQEDEQEPKCCERERGQLSLREKEPWGKVEGRKKGIGRPVDTKER